VSSPITKTDLVFLKHFAMVIGALVLITIGLMALAAWIYYANPPAAHPRPGQNEQERIAPVGAIYAGDTGRAAMEKAQEDARKALASQVAYGGTLDGRIIYGNLCTSCHGTGAGNAPKLEKAAWEARLAQGMDTLVKHAIEGYTGKAGMMPARGGNPALTDEQVKASVDWMVSQIK